MDRQIQRSGQGMVRRWAVLLGSAALLLPLAEPVGQRTGAGAVARTLLARAATAMATPAQAQTTTTLVNNSGATLVSDGSTNRHAQAFTTGTAANSYTVTRVQVRFASVHNTSGSAVIREDNGGQPGNLVATLVNPGSFTSGLNTFTAPADTVLEPGTTYWLSIHEGVDPRFVVRVTTSNRETGLPGWSIADNHLEREEDDDIWEPGDTTVAMKVVGYANTNDAPTVANPIADQTVTVGETLSFAFPDTTFEDTDTDDTLTYTALLDDGSALPGWLMFDTANRHFEGTPQAGDGGAITVRVTADDGTATVHDDFNIRVGTTCPAPTFGTRRQIWTGTVTVGFAPDDPNAGFYGFEDGGQGVLDDETFNIIGANDYTITRATVATGGELDGILAFSLQANNVLTPKEKENLRLHVCDMSYHFDDATLVADRRYEWSTSGGLDWSGESTRTLYLSLPANTPATGTPTISSDADAGATVGDMLTAEQGDMADSDGLPTSTFPEGYTIQWVREDEDGMNGENITGETSQTYMLTEDDVGKKVRVRVRFTDQLGSMETVTSDAFPDSGTVIGPGVSVTPTSVSPIEGRTVSYTLVLDTLPAGAVTITPTSDDSGAVSLSPASFTFTTANWDTPRTVSVTALQDDDTTSETVTISHSVSGYDTLTPADAVTVTVTDDDTAGVSVSTASLSPSEGRTVSYTVTLVTQPAGAVTITPTSDDSGAVSVAPASLVFTTANWGTQTVTVTALQDDDGNAETVTISHSVSGYDTLTSAPAVMVTVTDDDTAGVSVTPPTGGDLNEGETRTYTLQLNTQPDGPVTITPSSSGDSEAVSVSPASLTIIPSDWNTAQTVTVTAVDDDVDTGNQTVTISHSVSGYGPTITTATAVTVTVTDDDTAGVNVTPPTGGDLNEGETRTYTLQLNTQPDGPVTITPSSSGDSEAVSVSPASLTIIPSDWNTAQTVTVTAVDDDVDTGNQTVTISHSVSGYGPTITTATAVTVTVTDDDTAGVSVTPPTGGDLNEGETRTYTLQLNTQPDGPVTITPSSSGDSEAVSVSPASLTIIPSDWNTAQTVTVTAVDDDVDTGNQTVTISHSVSGYGPTITTATAVTVTVTDDDTAGMSVTDNDTAGVSVTPTSLSPSEGRTVSYTVTLRTQPDGAVTITPISGDSSAVSVAPASLTFTADTWNTPQTVSVTALQDDDNTTSETVTIRHSVSGYDTVSSAAAVTVTVTDDDVAGVSVTPTSLSSSEGRTVSYTVTLRTQPDGAVTITPTSGDSGAVSVAPASLAFTTANWDTPRTVTVTAVDDNDDTDETVTIRHSVSGYDTVSSAAAVTVTVTDSDAPGVSVQPTSVSTDEGETATYTLQLRTRPAGAVTITPTSGDSGAVSVAPASLTFTASNWNTPRTVTVTGVDDNDDTDETVTIRHGVSGYGPTITTADPVTVTVTDTTTDATDKAEEAEAVLYEVVLPHLIQQLTAQTTAVITSRLNTVASESPSASVTISLEEVLADTVAALHGEREHLENGSLEWRQAFSGRDFAFPLSGLTLAQGEGVSGQEHPFSSLAVWGGGNYSSYGNTVENTDVDGGGFSGIIGMDMQPTPQLVTGLTLTTSRWGLDYATDATDASQEGTYKLGVTMLNPYLNWLATDQLNLWAIFGYGRGAVEYNPDRRAATTRTDSFTSWAGGLRFEVVPGADPRTGEGPPVALALKVDGAAASFLDIHVQLARLAAEVARSFPVETGLLTAAVDLGWSIRSVSDKDDPDGLQQVIADKNDGGGAELAGSLHWLNADGSVSATVDTRVLLGGGDHREWGMGGHLLFTPSKRDGEGLSLSLQPAFGVTDTRLDELWSLTWDGDPAMGNDLPGARLDAELAYGFRHGDALLTPYTEVAWEEAASTYGAGLRYDLNPFLELDLKGAHRRRANGNDENRLLLEVRSDL